MLSTAVIKVKDADDKYQFARALLDSGSQPSFITEALCQKLRLKRIKLNSPVSGIGQSTLTVHHVLPKLTVSLPSQHIDVSRWRIPRNLPLADPQFNVSQGLDIIIGAELFFNLLDNQQLLLAAGYPILQQTVLGYIVCGKVSEPVSEPTVTQCSHVCAEDPLDSQLERFWEIENFDDGKAFTSDEQFCEDHFTDTVSRDQKGRYMVRLPMRQEILSMLGDSYKPALRRFLSMEKKFVADEGLRQEYKQFMQEYDRLGHMEVLSRASYSPQFSLPHHAIHRPESSTTKIRVVFDGSSRGSTQLSLNDVLYAGPTVQPALYSTVINFRLPRLAITADVEKMFRQTLVHPEDRRYQQILWRNDPSELGNCQFALKILVRLAQATAFPAEVRLYQNNQRCLVNSKELGSKSLLRNLNCLMDDFGLLILDGRLRYKNAPFDTRFPMILPADHKLTWLIARSLHVQTLHAGLTLLLATIRQRFGPLRGRHLARRVVRNCINCYRCNPRCSNQQMAPLPSIRVTPARAFAYSGMDYCGPFLVRPLVGRGASVKIYVALFVCLVVKAVHREVVADLTSVACINAVKRFVARSGRVFELHCDNATAFVGADRELKAARQAFREHFRSKQWDEYCTISGITFRFIPARSPHFGWLWEAGIKSFKYHFRRMMSCKTFNMDQLLTVVAPIESVLNSRPLAPLSDSPDDTSALTPGHFLIGEALFSIPEPDLCDLGTKRLSRLQDMKRSAQDLWRRWSRDYLSQLQQRSKWKKETADVEVGQLVLMKQDNTPSLQWPLGRITETIFGPDGHVRVVVVKTAAGTYKRAVTEIAVLPIDEKNSQLAVETGSFNGDRHVGDSI
ncbi:uncharacterized protein LOC131680291 [Topomyia yanbarensis]|uniref:uncharacterized protein LOC131680291 n=1 Tax=Topomyia yanbarensis TaxID=2498891 RepID=UPI00273BA823|nr:uncharacterized protein LOC131680291 [Topomyia yanbarensis]